MRLFNKENKNKETRSLPMGKKSKSALTAYSALVLMLCCCTTTAFAAQRPFDGYQQPQRLHFRPHPGYWYDPAGLRRGADPASLSNPMTPAREPTASSLWQAAL